MDLLEKGGRNSRTMIAAGPAGAVLRNSLVALSSSTAHLPTVRLLTKFALLAARRRQRKELIDVVSGANEDRPLPNGVLTPRQLRSFLGRHRDADE